jgi:hypothetical protein
MVNMPPGSAKSTYGSVLFPAWAFAQRDGFDIIGASNTGRMAEGFSRKAMATAADHQKTLGYALTRDTAEEWTTTNRGHYRAAGVGGSIAGERADLAIIDDPTRSRADAESLTVRESQWAWFTGDLRTRLKPDAAIVVIMTRWACPPRRSRNRHGPPHRLSARHIHHLPAAHACPANEPAGVVTNS